MADQVAIEYKTMRRRNAMASRLLLIRLERYHGAEDVADAMRIPVGGDRKEAIPEPVEPVELKPKYLRVTFGAKRPPSYVKLDPKAAAPRSGKVTAYEVAREASRLHTVPYPLLAGEGRDAKVVIIRQLGYYVARELAGATLTQIGRAFGGKDHTSVLHGCRKIERLMAEQDQSVIAAVNRLKAFIIEKYELDVDPMEAAE